MMDGGRWIACCIPTYLTFLHCHGTSRLEPSFPFPIHPVPRRHCCPCIPSFVYGRQSPYTPQARTRTRQVCLALPCSGQRRHASGAPPYLRECVRGRRLSGTSDESSPHVPFRHGAEQTLRYEGGKNTEASRQTRQSLPSTRTITRHLPFSPPYTARKSPVRGETLDQSRVG